MSSDDARAEAIRRLGASLDQVRHQLHTNADQRERRLRVVESFESVTQDVRYAARGLARRPAFTAVAVLTLAIGVGATTAIFSAVNVLLLRPLPYARPDELMNVSLILPAEGGRPSLTPGFAYPTYAALRNAQRSFNSLAVYTPTQTTLTSGDVERVGGEYVSATYLRTLGLAPERGRDFDRSLDAHVGAPHEVIISYALLQEFYMYGTQVAGPLPASLGSLTALKTLNLSYNQLSGSIPETFGALTKLEKLDLYHNQLSGAIPSSLGSASNLVSLNLTNNSPPRDGRGDRDGSSVAACVPWRVELCHTPADQIVNVILRQPPKLGFYGSCI